MNKIILYMIMIGFCSQALGQSGAQQYALTITGESASSRHLVSAGYDHAFAAKPNAFAILKSVDSPGTCVSLRQSEVLALIYGASLAALPFFIQFFTKTKSNEAEFSLPGKTIV